MHPGIEGMYRKAEANPIFLAKSYRTLVKNITNGALFTVTVPSSIPFYELHVYGSAYERGFAHGALLSDQILELLLVQLPAFFALQADQIPLGKLPSWLQKIIKQQIEKDAPGAIMTALRWVHQTQAGFINSSLSRPMDEMQGLAAGVCSEQIPSDCDVDNIASLIQATNELPELLKMQCSMLGAYGPATLSGKLTQMRTLDFGEGPFANLTLLVVHHPTSSAPFALVGFPSFVGAVTGFSSTIGLSEKVDDVYSPSSKPPGSFQGKPVALVIREIVEFASDKAAAVSITRQASRTWPVWLGFGDENQSLWVLNYTRDEIDVFVDANITLASGQPAMRGIVFLDKHPQPSPDTTLQTLLASAYGKLTPSLIASIIPLATQSGDVHLAVYDFGGKQVFIARGITDASGAYLQYAYQAPVIQWSMDELFSQTL